VSPQDPGGTYTKFGVELAEALDAVADDPGLIEDPVAALDMLGIELPPEIAATVTIDADGLRRAAEAIRAGAIPAFWPWVWYIPWVGFVEPQGMQQT
jgi:hypothetical protein